ncbi:MAG: type I-C CRISPR-associated endonuclease Cas1c [Candidatus Brocadiia bacterium]
MEPILNTLFVTTEGAYLRKEHERVVIELPDAEDVKLPLRHLGSLVLFGRAMLTPALLRWCGENGLTVTWLTRHGRFCGRLVGPQSGNVLLRLEQHRAAADSGLALSIARNIVAGKVQNTRNSILRSRRDCDDEQDRSHLQAAADHLAACLRALPGKTALDEVRGIEGEAARTYFGVLDTMIRPHAEKLSFCGRVRRPPTDPVNSLLSFLYAILVHDCAAAAEGVGLDPQVGFLHAPRPGRPALALDLMEELRPVLADRLTLTLLNRRQLKPEDFERRQGGAVHIADDARRTVLKAFQQRKQDEITHPVLDRPMPLGLVPHVQARLLARTLRGDLDAYPPFIYG